MPPRSSEPPITPAAADAAVPRNEPPLAIGAAAGPAVGAGANVRRCLWPAAARSRFPAPIGSEPSAVPADHRLRLEDFQCVQYSRRHMIERGKHQPVNAAERQSLRGFAPQHVELMSKDEVLGLQRSPRPEHSNQGAPDQPAKIAHRERVSADSRSRSAVLSLR
jgi:hypothetical protein